MLVFSKNYKYEDPLNIVFLCGSYYDKNSKRDKRTILKEYIDRSIPNFHGIILEENFQFAATTKQYLSYDNIYLTGLAQIEQLASLYASKIIIVHETISTAAELGMFAIDPTLAHKICLLVPDKFSVEEEKVSNFIRLAFLREKAPDTKVQIIRYYPDVEIYRTSPNKSDYWSFFHDDKIGVFLGKDLKAFLADKGAKKTICFRENYYRKSSSDENIVDYTISSKNKDITVRTHVEPLKIHLLAMLGVDSIRKKLREEKEIWAHVNFIYDTYRSILRNTVENLTGISTADYTVSVSLKGSYCDLKQAIGYFIYMLQAAKLINLVQRSSGSPTIRRIQFSTMLDTYEKNVDGAVIEAGTTEYGRFVT